MGEEEGKSLARRNIPAPAEFARTNSGSASALTAADVLNGSRRPDVYAPPEPAAWSDEKHNQYIQSLEASFVAQLHRSINLYNAPPKNKFKPYSPGESPLKSHNSSRQFTVLRNGRWQKSSRRNELPTESTADSHFVGETPEVSGSLGVSEIPPEKGCNHLQQALLHEETYEGNSVVYSARKPGKRHFGLVNQDLVGEAIDCSGQNFVDVNVGEKSNCPAAAKMSKTADAFASTNYQFIRFLRLCRWGCGRYTRPLECESRPCSHKFCSENLARFRCSQCVVHYIM